jgi:hypothetical protein
VVRQTRVAAKAKTTPADWTHPRKRQCRTLVTDASWQRMASGTGTASLRDGHRMSVPAASKLDRRPWSSCRADG